ncbi:hypothetical protein N9S11_00095 [Candidatus Pelagibacter sp.]|nr:hypothetical protein [Candidatus Pelagibacter sp.]
METIVDQLDAVNSNSFLKEIKNPENIKDLIIKNYNKDTEWSDLDKFINLEKLQLNNCLIENNSFFLSISKIKKLKIFKYDYECYFKSSEEKTKINLLSINKIILDFKSSEETNLSLLSLTDNQNNFINSFPNFPNAYQNIEELEFNNYDTFLDYVKKEDYDYEYIDLYKGKDLFYNCDIYNLSRLKKLENIIFTKNKNNKEINNTILDKILSLPNHKKIKINNSLIKDIKDQYFKGQKMFLDYTYYPYDDNFYTDIKKHSKYNDCIDVHWPSQKYNGYKDKFKELLKQEIEHIIVSPTFDFIWETYVDFEGSSIDDFEKEFLKIKKLKKITFEFPSKPTVQEDEILTFENKDYDGYIMDKFICLLHNVFKKNIEVEIDFKDVESFNDLGEDHSEYIQLFYLFINIQKHKKIKDKFKIKNLNIKQCEEYFEKLVLDKIKSIVVIDDQSNSKILKQFKNIELLHDYSTDMGLEFLNINSGLISYDVSKIDNSEDDSFRHFLYEDEDWWIQFVREKHYLNPGKVKVVVKKEWLDKSNKLIFKNLDTISFHLIGKEAWMGESIFNNKKFNFPKSIDYKKIEYLNISKNFKVDLNDLIKFEKLNELRFNNHLFELNQNFRDLPTLKKLKKLLFGIGYSAKEDETTKISKIEKLVQLEELEIDLQTYNRDNDFTARVPVNLKNIHTLKNLKKLVLNFLHLPFFKDIGKLNKLKNFELLNPHIVRINSNEDFLPVDPPMTEENLSFLKDMSELEKIKLYLPRFNLETNNFNGKKLISLINPNIKELRIDCGFGKNKITEVHGLFNEIIERFKYLEILDLTIYCIDAPELKYDKRVKGGEEKADLQRNNEAKNPLIVDFSKLIKLKKLKVFKLSNDNYFGNRILNPLKAINCLKLEEINLPIKIDMKVLEEIFNKISTERQQFLIKMNKDKAYKDKDLVDSRYDLNEDDKEKYDQIKDQNERKIKINGENLSNIIFETYKKKIKK